ncbi:hypothetical protein NC653_039192 [Populus alba x Populus x berolinensis]|uniref:Uncharacterized protein n=1 Tax=Populus alba x Populus x berolinensis TaxID=444605 RepID=A0AAD6LAW3_9ROSI|nr:hypothetical protein NC653_039192 [Populus alba x Populus x berolinensis]
MENSYVSSSWNPSLFEQPISAEKFFLTGERRQGVLVIRNFDHVFLAFEYPPLAIRCPPGSLTTIQGPPILPIAGYTKTSANIINRPQMYLLHPVHAHCLSNPSFLFPIVHFFINITTLGKHVNQRFTKLSTLLYPTLSPTNTLDLQFPKQTNRITRPPHLHVPTNHRTPRNGIQLAHFIEHLSWKLNPSFLSTTTCTHQSILHINFITKPKSQPMNRFTQVQVPNTITSLKNKRVSSAPPFLCFRQPWWLVVLVVVWISSDLTLLDFGVLDLHLKGKRARKLLRRVK